MQYLEIYRDTDSNSEVAFRDEMKIKINLRGMIKFSFKS